jgi:hypothetical protein
MKVKPVIPGAVIRDPVTKRQLPDKGDEVPDTSFWVRRLLAGEVERIDESSEIEPEHPTEPAAATPSEIEPELEHLTEPAAATPSREAAASQPLAPPVATTTPGQE